MAEQKLPPCEKCQYRKAMAKAFDVHIWGEDCPEWEKCKQKADNNLSTQFDTMRQKFHKKEMEG